MESTLTPRPAATISNPISTVAMEDGTSTPRQIIAGMILAFILAGIFLFLSLFIYINRRWWFRLATRCSNFVRNRFDSDTGSGSDDYDDDEYPSSGRNSSRRFLDNFRRCFGYPREGRLQLPLLSTDSNAISLESRSTRPSRGRRLLERLKGFVGYKESYNALSSADESLERERSYSDSDDISESPSNEPSEISTSQVGGIDMLDEDDLRAIAEAAGLSLPELTNRLGSELSPEEIRDQKRQAIREGCTDEFETMLWSTVKFPETITTTYSNIHVPESTIKSLKSASIPLLIDQEEFIHGVLSNKAMPGLLLYGLPGTGKTQLVQALAKDCEATVLSVSSAELTSKWVGESEKIVRAMFSLARKLSPCIVFVDEADSICGQRDSYDRKHERAFLAQFLQEWDGFSTDSSKRVLVVMATNRPYDLDEAIIRRAPARVLVDIPTARDRESILKIHLQGQELASDVDLAEVAAHTVDFTGSDLKNLCIAAAYNLVLERVGQIPRTGIDEPCASTSRTVATQSRPSSLRAEHFEKALCDIRPSTDTYALSKIRNYHNKQHSSTLRPQSVHQNNSDMTAIQSSEVPRKVKFKSRVPAQRLAYT